MAERLGGRKAIITGAADGIGEATAKLFAVHGSSVLAVDIDGDRLRAALADHPSIHCLEQDIAADGAALVIIEHAKRVLGGLDILVNNAAVRGARVALCDATDEEWRNVMAVNVDAVFRLVRAAVPLLEASDRGRIVNISSVHAIQVVPKNGPYAPSKAAIAGLTRSLAVDLAPRGITANFIMPGATMTGLMRQVMRDDPQLEQAMVARTPMGRFADPIEIARVALFFASEDSSFVTGQGMSVDGGTTILL
jgi:NAD(P)-dependent dehydrogenase (short-subunit alcohol dehydrogenase family)